MSSRTKRPITVSAAARRRRRARRSRDGAVMLVIMLVLMVATASAAVSINTVQSEIQSAGNERVALQTRYVAETAMMTTISWVEMLADSGQWLQTWEQWQGQPPPMAMYAEPEIGNGTASRTTMQAQDAL